MNQKLLQQAVELTKQIMITYFSQRDIYAVLDKMAPDVTWIGPGEKEKKYTFEEIKAYFELGKDVVPACEVSDFDLRGVDLGENYCLVAGSMMVRTLPESKLIIEANQRLSFVYRLQYGEFSLVHIHNSNPYAEMGSTEHFPHKIGSQSYQYLQRLLNEKIELLDMIAGNINGGLKGSNDDSTFSYYYVNEGLPQMLGYTYDEFMEESGGSAAGAVYPPDLPFALADAERCFAKGGVYSSEYRMKKKDGSLIWVLDSGRKMIDSEGVTRINSIITDITPLKQALFDLEIEQERYRIALEHIVGVMCEYDIAKDVFTIYHKTDADGEHSVKHSEIGSFTEKICSGDLCSKEDGVAFVALCLGQKTSIIEIHTRLPYLDGQWHWVQFSCSLVSDHAGTLVRAIGILKDVTEERTRNLELMKQAQCDSLTGLFNHSTTKEQIEACLRDNAKQAPEKYALLMLDIDRFKEVNDQHGHACGDEVLVRTAQIMEKAVGTDSIVGRIGGDEFLALVKDKEPADVAKMAEEIIRRVREIGEDRDFTVSCSIGIAYYFQQQESFAQFFERADKALYHAKNSGRNRAFIDSPVLENDTII